MRRVVITGMGVLSPIGNDVETFWQNCINGVNGVGPITKFDTSKFKTHFACEVKDFDPTTVVPRKDVRKYDNFTLYALAVTEQALQQAELNLETVNKRRVGVVWGSGNGGFETFQHQTMEFAQGDGTPRFNPYFIPKVLVDIASGVISIKYGFQGPNYTTVSACASATTAIIDAFNQIKWGKCEVMITGGSESAICEVGIGGFNALKALSTRNDDYHTASRPFDTQRDGFVMGEGAAAFVLEEYEHAIQRGATIIAEVVGGGMAGDAYHLTGTHPDGEGAVIGMEEAMKEAGIQPSQVDHINAHATSTPLGDQSELIAIERVFGTNSNVVISATKSMTGHLLGAAGAVEGMIAALSCQRNVIPPTINTTEIEPEFTDKFTLSLNSKVEKEVNYALSNTFGFGGHIASVLFKKFNNFSK
jgi:3-oxoacyl-[acyl-carrier-protein] synthase II